MTVMMTTMMIMMMALLMAAASASIQSLAVQSQTTTGLQWGRTTRTMRASAAAAQQQQEVIRRWLEVGDFAAFTVLLDDAYINLADTQIVESLFLGDLTLDLTNITCFDLSIGDATTTYTNTTTTTPSQEWTLDIDATSVAMNCFAEYTYNLGLLNGAGNMTAFTKGNSLQTSVLFTSDAPAAPPSFANISSCVATIVVDDLQILGDGVAIIAQAASVFENLIKGYIQREVSTTACDELTALGDSLTTTLTTLNKQFDVYLQPPTPPSLINPLAPEDRLQRTKPKNVTLLDFQNDESTFLELVRNLLDSATDLLNQTVEDVGGPTGTNQDLNINVLLRDFLLEEDRSFTLDMTNVKLFPDNTTKTTTDTAAGNPFLKANFSLTTVKLFGLDTIRSIDALQIIGKQTFNNNIVWDYLRLEANMTVTFQTLNNPNGSSDILLVDPTPSTLVEQMTVTVQLDNMTSDLALLLAVDQTALFGLSLGSLMVSENILPCALSTLYELNITGLTVSIGHIQPPLVAGFTSTPGMGRLLGDFVEFAYVMYYPSIVTALPNVFQTLVRDVLNDQLVTAFTTGQDSSTCPDPFLTEGVVDFRDLFLSPDASRAMGGTGQGQYGDVVPMLMDLLREQFIQVDPDTQLSNLNPFIDRFTETQSGTPGSLTYDKPLVNTNSRLNIGNLDARVRLMIWNAYVDNLNTLGAPLAVLENVPQQAYRVNNTATIGVYRPLTMGTRFYFRMYNSEVEIVSDLDMTIRVDELNAVLMAMARMSEKALQTFPLGDVLIPDCWIATVPTVPLDEGGIRQSGVAPTASVEDISGHVSSVGMNISCVNCTGPKMEEWAALLGTPAAADGTTNTVNNILEYVTALGGDFLQISTDRLLYDAPRRCPHHPDFVDRNFSTTYPPFNYAAYESTGFGILVGFVLFIASLLVFVILIILIKKCIILRRHYKWLEKLSREEVVGLWLLQKKDQEKETALNDNTKAMFMSPTIPLMWRLAMPLIILGNVGFFLSGHLNLGANVNLVFSFGGQTMAAENFFQFSMLKSAVEIWDAGGHELSALIFILSVFWPYGKQLITFCLWFCPPSIVGVSRRGSVFLWLDFLAKWSMVDIYTLVVTVAAFRVRVRSPGVDFLPSDIYSLDLLVVPMWGLYANMIAQLISQLSSHVIVHYHRRIIDVTTRAHNLDHSVEVLKEGEEEEEAVEDENDNGHQSNGEKPEQITNSTSSSSSSSIVAEKLGDHGFSRAYRAEHEKVTPRGFVGPLVILIAISVVVLIILGCVIPTFSVELLGLIAVMVEAGQQFREAKTFYSLFTLIGMLFAQAEFTGRIQDHIGLGSLSALLIWSTLVVPILQTCALVWMWFRTMDLKSRRHWALIIEILQAWQYAEVYLVSIVVASWQLGPVSDWMINEYCGGLEPFFSNLVFYGVIQSNDAQCFRVESKIEYGSLILAVGTIMLALMNTFIMNAVTQYFRDRTTTRFELENRSLSCDDETSKISRRINISPLLFSDKFRYLLRKDGSLAPSAKEEDKEQPAEDKE